MENSQYKELGESDFFLSLFFQQNKSCLYSADSLIVIQNFKRAVKTPIDYIFPLMGNRNNPLGCLPNAVLEYPC